MIWSVGYSINRSRVAFVVQPAPEINLAQALLMCSPEGFAVEYEINPWMAGHVGAIDRQLAIQQWQALYRQLSLLAGIEVMDANPAWPDLVFTANAGLPLSTEKTFILSNFRHPQRQGEKSINRHWFETRGWQCVELDDSISFEGAGDALFASPPIGCHCMSAARSSRCA